MLAVFIVLLSAFVAEGRVLRSSYGQNFLDSHLHAADLLYGREPGGKPHPGAWKRANKNREANAEIIVEGVDNSTEGRHIGGSNRSETGVLSWVPDNYEKQYEQTKREMYQHQYPFIYAVDNHLAKAFGKYTDIWWRDWKIWVGGTLWAVVLIKWVRSGYEEQYEQRFCFAAGINLVILHHLQYAESVRSGMIFICLLLTGQCLLQNVIWFGSGSREKEHLFLCDTMYLDLTLPAVQIFVLFLAQFCIWWFYMTSILGTFDWDHVNYAFWVAAFIVMQMTMIFNRGSDSVLGNPFPILDVYHLVVNCDNIALRLVDSESAGPIVREGSKLIFKEKSQHFQNFHVSKVSLIMRGVFGFFCNGILREIMSYTIPLMLMGFSEPMDFVVYCLGVNFICTIDDMGDKTFKLIPLDDIRDVHHDDTPEVTPRKETWGGSFQTTTKVEHPTAPPPPPAEPGRTERSETAWQGA